MAFNLFGGKRRITKGFFANSLGNKQIRGIYTFQIDVENGELIFKKYFNESPMLVYSSEINITLFKIKLYNPSYQDSVFPLHVWTWIFAHETPGSVIGILPVEIWSPLGGHVKKVSKFGTESRILPWSCTKIYIF